jgi:putative molybdopterin biosynthesis protein
LERADVRLANRNRGSGTRLWLDLQLRDLTIPAVDVHGYSSEHRTHTAVAEAISTGKADAGIGLLAAAQKLGLDFIPLFRERFDLVYPEDLVGNPNITALFDTLTSGQFRRIVQNLGGYETAQTGDERLVD